jgi:hypothetical protein
MKTTRFENSYIKTIYEKFIKPLRIYCPAEWEEQEWFAYLFNIDNVTIETYYAKSGFSVPGLYKDTPLRPIQGIGYRYIQPSMPIWVRKDNRRNDYDVSFMGNGIEQVYLLTDSEWYMIRPRLKKAGEDEHQ